MTLYFAYGSNMHRGDMRLRCPGAASVGVAMLEGWRFIISEDGYASIVRGHGVVHGVLWRVNARDLAALDAYEDMESGLYTRVLMTVRYRSTTSRALVYVGSTTTVGEPLAGYQERVISAAQEWKLPSDYLRELRQWRGKRVSRAAVP